MRSIFTYRNSGDLPKTIPVFPLDHAVLLPGTILPLNIFEPRYVAMIDHALKTDRIIGMIQTNDSDSTTRHNETLMEVGCAGRITQFSETGDGRYLITLSGISRYQIEKEISSEDEFRICSVDFKRFAYDLHEPADISEDTRSTLIDTFKQIAEQNNLRIDWDEVTKTNTSTLVNGMSMLQFFSLSEKQALLEADDIQNRADLLIAIAEVRNNASKGDKAVIQ